MKPYHYILITLALAITTEVADSFGNMFLLMGPLSDRDYLSIQGQIWSLILNVMVISYPLVLIWLAFPKDRPQLIRNRNAPVLVFVLVASMAILMSVCTHPFNEFYLVKAYYTSETFQPYSSLIKGEIVYTLSVLVLLILAPIVQEILFRGYLTERLMSTSSAIGAFLLQLICFVIFQLIVSGSLTETIAVGLACGVIYIRTRNILLGIVFNLVYSISTQLITSRAINEYIYNNLFGTMYWIAVGLALCSVIILAIRGKRLTSSIIR